MFNYRYNYTHSWSDVVGWGLVTKVLVTRGVVAGRTLVSTAGSIRGQGNGLFDNIWLEDLALAINLVLPLVHFKLVELLPSLPAASSPSPSWRSGMLTVPLRYVD